MGKVTFCWAAVWRCLKHVQTHITSSINVFLTSGWGVFLRIGFSSLDFWAVGKSVLGIQVQNKIRRWIAHNQTYELLSSRSLVPAATRGAPSSTCAFSSVFVLADRSLAPSLRVCDEERMTVGVLHQMLTDWIPNSKPLIRKSRSLTAGTGAGAVKYRRERVQLCRKPWSGTHW